MKAENLRSTEFMKPRKTIRTGLTWVYLKYYTLELQFLIFGVRSVPSHCNNQSRKSKGCEAGASLQANLADKGRYQSLTLVLVCCWHWWPLLWLKIYSNFPSSRVQGLVLLWLHVKTKLPFDQMFFFSVVSQSKELSLFLTFPWTVIRYLGL